MSDSQNQAVSQAAKLLVSVCHGAALQGGWWNDLKTGESLTCNLPAGEKPKRNIGELLCLVHSEISEGMEGARKSKADEHLPHRPSEMPEGYKFHESRHPRAICFWRMACMSQELLTDTDPMDALSALED